MVARQFRFGIVGNDLLPRVAWQELARKAEACGYATLLAADHLGMPSALARIVSAAEATSALRLGSFVLNNDFHLPLRLAQEAATVDDLTGGRLELGVGSGWARPEYELLERGYQSPSARAVRLDSSIDVMKRAWAGETVIDWGGGTVPAVPRPTQHPHPPLLIGGHGDAVLAVAARQADIVGLTGATLVNGSWRPTGASAETAQQRIEFVRKSAGDRFSRLEINVRSSMVVVTDMTAAVTAKVAALRGVPAAVVTDSPFALIGSCGQLADKLLMLRERLGISYWAMPSSVIDDFAPVVAQLRGR